MAAPRGTQQERGEAAEDEWTTRHGGGAVLIPGPGALRPVGPGPRRSVLLVKLTDSALRVLEAAPGQRGASCPQPKICLGGEKGYMKIPVPLSESPSGFRTFSIYRSRDGAQGSFDCVHQHVDWLGVPRLDCVGTVQEKLTVCATDDSYQATRERMTQAEEETRSRGAIVIKPGGPFNGKRTVRRLPPELMDLAPGRKRSAPLNPANTLRKAPAAGTNSAVATTSTTAAALRPASPVAAAAAAAATTSSGPAEALRRPMHERVVHFLALRPCKKAELVARLERDSGGVGGGGQCDRSQVFAILEQVASPRGQDGRHQLKEAAYAEVRQDWPGYSPEERRAVQALLSRRATQQHPPPSGLSHNAPQPRLSPAAEASRPRNHTAQKRPNTSTEEDAEPSLGGQQQQKMSQNGTKKPRVSHLTSRVPPTPCDRPEPPRREKDEGAAAAVPPCQPLPDTARRKMKKRKEKERERETPAGKEMPRGAAAKQGDAGMKQEDARMKQGDAGTSEDRIMQRGRERQMDTGMQRDRGMQRDGERELDMWMQRDKRTQGHRDAQREKEIQMIRATQGDKELLNDRETKRVTETQRERETSKGMETQRNIETNRDQETHRDRDRQRDTETQRETVAQREAETQKDRETQRESDRERERNRERPRDREQERQRQRYRDVERDKQREREMQEEKDKQQERDRERERQEERDKQQERERQEGIDKQRGKERQEEREKRREPAKEVEVDSQGVSEEELQYKKLKMDSRADKPELKPEHHSSATSNPDYKLDYVPIVTPEQRQRYKADFSSEFSEYRRLHRRIDTVKRRFEQLQHKMHAFAPDSREQQVIRKQVVQEYSKVKKTNPDYQQEKRRCEYLHSKLAHIKQLITDYDQSS